MVPKMSQGIKYNPGESFMMIPEFIGCANYGEDLNYHYVTQTDSWLKKINVTKINVRNDDGARL